MSLKKPLTYSQLHANLGTELESVFKQNRIVTFYYQISLFLLEVGNVIYSILLASESCCALCSIRVNHAATQLQNIFSLGIRRKGITEMVTTVTFPRHWGSDLYQSVVYSASFTSVFLYQVRIQILCHGDMIRHMRLFQFFLYLVSFALLPSM